MNPDVVYLKDDDLLVIGSLFGGDVIYGIESRLFRSMDELSHPKVKQVLDRLLEMQMMRLDYSGKLIFSKEHYEMFEALAHPEQILSIKINMHSNHQEVYYYYRKKDEVYELKRGMNLNRFQKIQAPLVIEGTPMAIDETLTTQDVLEVEEYINWFDEEGALQYLKEKTTNADIIKKIIDRAFDQYEISYCFWEGKTIAFQKELTIGVMHKEVFEWIKEGDVIHIQGGTKQLNLILEAMFRR